MTVPRGNTVSHPHPDHQVCMMRLVASVCGPSLPRACRHAETTNKSSLEIRLFIITWVGTALCSAKRMEQYHSMDGEYVTIGWFRNIMDSTRIWIKHAATTNVESECPVNTSLDYMRR